VTALGLCHKLKGLVETGRCTVVCTLHQPSSKLFSLLDNVTIVKAGHIVYQASQIGAVLLICRAWPPKLTFMPRLPQGSTRGALTSYSRAGFPCPALTNPADHLLDVITPVLGVSTQEADANEDQLKRYHSIVQSRAAAAAADDAGRSRGVSRAMLSASVDLGLGLDKPWVKPRDRIPWTRQFIILSRRTLREAFRQKEILLVQVRQRLLRGYYHPGSDKNELASAVWQMLTSVTFAVLIGMVFPHIGHTQRSIQQLQPVLFVCVINQGIFAALLVINSFPKARDTLGRMGKASWRGL
jgi:ATP-binding cassette, subfamily G (WHITE), member 2